jgi:ParB-like nuclease domain
VTLATAALVVEQVPIDALRPDPANPRRISESELEALTRSMRRYGLVQPILVRREDDTVIGGHQRLVAARRLGLDTVPVIKLDLSAEQARLLNLALNRISGEWDEDLLARLLAELGQSVEVDLSLSGFGDDEIRTCSSPSMTGNGPTGPSPSSWSQRSRKRDESRGPSRVTCGGSASTASSAGTPRTRTPCGGCSTAPSPACWRRTRPTG